MRSTRFNKEGLCVTTISVFSRVAPLHELFYAVSFLIALSRVFVGVHWPFDIFAGALLGILTALLINFLFKKYGEKYVTGFEK